MSASKFVITSPSGQVVREYTGLTPPSIEPSQSVHEVGIDFVDYLATYHEGGEFHPLPARPSRNHRFNYATKQWEDPRSLEDFKAAKRVEINAARATANAAYFEFSGKQIAADALSRSDIDGVTSYVTLMDALPPGFPGGWKALDNTYVAIPDVATWRTFVAAMVAQGTANFTRAQARKAAIEAAVTVSAVDAVAW